MAQHNRYGGKRQTRPVRPARNAPPAEPKPVWVKKVPTVYGKPFILLEDAAKNTFAFKGGAWSPHAATIAEYRINCQVKELPQKVNGKSRYEIRCPVEDEA